MTAAVALHPAAAKLGRDLAGSLIRQAATRARAEWQQHRTWQLAIAEGDDLYPHVHRWLLEHTEARTRRALTAVTRYQSPDPNLPPVAELRLQLDGATAQRVQLDGHPVTVHVADGGGAGADTGDLAGPVGAGRSLMRPDRLVFVARTRAGRDAAVALLRRLSEQAAAERRQPSLWVLDRWSNWTRRADLPGRTLDSVIVGGGTLTDLHEDLRTFREQEPEYVRRGIPYHRAYLLHGPPGTGKTSAVKAIANALRLDLWFAQLDGIDKDARLGDLLGQVRPHSILLLEDIDSLPAALDREGHEDAKGDVSTSGLLNALDGVATPHGLVTIMTTNHPGRLDPALLRPGRIDRRFELGLPDRATIARHYEFFYGRPPHRPEALAGGVSSAEVSEVLKRNLHDPAAAELALRRLAPVCPRSAAA